jgi:hypothetical protein
MCARELHEKKHSQSWQHYSNCLQNTKFKASIFCKLPNLKTLTLPHREPAHPNSTRFCLPLPTAVAIGVKTPQAQAVLALRTEGGPGRAPANSRTKISQLKVKNNNN